MPSARLPGDPPGRTVTRATSPRPHHAAAGSWLCLPIRSSCPGRAHCQPAEGTWRPLGVSLARARCRAAKPAPSRRGRMGKDPTVGAAMNQALPSEAAGMVFRRCRSWSERRAVGRLLAERGSPQDEPGVADADLFGLWDLTAPAGEALA